MATEVNVANIVGISLNHFNNKNFIASKANIFLTDCDKKRFMLFERMYVCLYMLNIDNNLDSEQYIKTHMNINVKTGNLPNT